MNVFINTTSAKVKQNKLTKQSKRLRRRWRRRPQRQRHNKHKEPREVTQKKYIIKYPCIFYTHTHWNSLKESQPNPSEWASDWTNERMNEWIKRPTVPCVLTETTAAQEKRREKKSTTSRNFLFFFLLRRCCRCLSLFRCRCYSMLSVLSLFMLLYVSFSVLYFVRAAAVAVTSTC